MFKNITEAKKKVELFLVPASLYVEVLRTAFFFFLKLRRQNTILVPSRSFFF